MPTNAQLTREAHLLADDLGEQVTTEGLNNAKLVDLVAELKARAREKAEAPPPPPPPSVDGASQDFAGGPPKPKPAQAKAELKHPMQVAPGRNIICKRGYLGPGSRVERRYFDDLRTLETFIRDGSILVREDHGPARSGAG